MIIPYRGDAYFVRELKLVGDLGQVLFQPYHLQDEESIRKAVKYSNVVINLVGRDWETKNFKFNEVHVEGARRIARISREMGVERLIHVSALNVDPLPAVSSLLMILTFYLHEFNDSLTFKVWLSGVFCSILL